MNKLTNEETAKVFAMYLGCEIKCKGMNLTLTGVNKSTNTYKERVYSYDLERSIVDCKLTLKPLSSISDEDAAEVAKILDIYLPEKTFVKKHSSGYTYLYYDFEGREQRCILFFDNNIRLVEVHDDFLRDTFIFQYLISKGYAVPLFFGINHWANGKTAIELGIAIENK